MPQFELEKVGPAGYSGVVRARTPEEAVRNVLESPLPAELAVRPTDDFAGWSEVVLDGRPAGRIRPHQRMRFRRD